MAQSTKRPVKMTTNRAGVDVVLQDTEAATNTKTGLINNAAEMYGTLTPRVGNTEEPKFVLRPNDVSELTAIHTEQFNPCFDELMITRMWPGRWLEDKKGSRTYRPEVATYHV